MQNFFLIIFLFINSTNSLLFPNFLKNTPILLNKPIEKKLGNNEICNQITKYSTDLINNNIYHFKTEYSPSIVKFSSKLLPAMDSIAHNVLKANENFICFVLDHDKIPENIKKDLVLFSISAAQNGDNIGSQILSFYYDTVDKLL
jgi:hypothetical protein